jgi:hypothetical protein
MLVVISRQFSSKPQEKLSTDPVRIKTPKPATPEAVVAALISLSRRLSQFDRVSIGTPGSGTGDVVLTSSENRPSINEIFMPSKDAIAKAPAIAAAVAAQPSAGVIISGGPGGVEGWRATA